MSFQRIRFRQTGGFAGLVRGCDLHAESLADPVRQELNHLIDRSGLLTRATPAARESHDQARDLMHYELDITSTSGTSHAALDDRDVTGDVAPLVKYLMKVSGPVALD